MKNKKIIIASVSFLVVVLLVSSFFFWLNGGGKNGTKSVEAGLFSLADMAGGAPLSASCEGSPGAGTVTLKYGTYSYTESLESLASVGFPNTPAGNPFNCTWSDPARCGICNCEGGTLKYGIAIYTSSPKKPAHWKSCPTAPSNGTIAASPTSCRIGIDCNIVLTTQSTFPPRIYLDAGAIPVRSSASTGNTTFPSYSLTGVGNHTFYLKDSSGATYDSVDVVANTICMSGCGSTVGTCNNGQVVPVTTLQSSYAWTCPSTPAGCNPNPGMNPASCTASRKDDNWREVAP
jgi:hypothetical protein